MGLEAGECQRTEGQARMERAVEREEARIGVEELRMEVWVDGY